MVLTKFSDGKNTCKRRRKSRLRKIVFTFLFFLTFYALASGDQINSATLNYSPDFLDIFPNSSIGPTIENLTKTDPLELGDNAIITADINHTDNGVDSILIEIGGTNYTMNYVSGNEYSHTWQPSAVGNIPFTIYANATTIGDLSSLADSIDVEDTTAPDLTNLNEFSGDPVEYNGAIEIRIDATDLLLDAVWIVFDSENYTMSPVSGDTFSYTNASIPLGTYSYTIYANDTEGNLATSSAYDITVEDTTDPSLSLPNEFSGDPVEYDNGIEIRVDATDLNLDTVWIVFDSENYTMGNVVLDTFSYANGTIAVGTYSYTIYANDTEGNLVSSLTYDITVQDTTDPLLSSLNEFSGDPVEYNGGIEIRIDATDLLLDAVWIVFDGENYSMSVVSGDTFSYTNASLGIGTYAYTVYANDTTGNLATSASGDISVVDTTDPLLSSLNEFSGDPVEYNGVIEIRIDATDLLLEAVWIVFDGENYSMLLVSVNTFSYTNASLGIGTYAYTVYANDTTGNLATSASGDISVVDTTDPLLSSLNEFSGDPVEYNGGIEIRIDSTDLLLEAVWIVFDGENYSMSLVSVNTFSYTNASLGIGIYSYTIYANDTTGNLATPVASDITVEDTTDPLLSSLNEFSGDPIEYNGGIEIRIDATDLLLDAVWIVFDGENYSMSVVSGDTYAYTNASLAIGTYTYTIYASDTTGNLATSATANITVEDTTDPLLSNLVEFSGDDVEYNGAIEIRIDATDLLLDAVWIVFDGENYSMSVVSGDTFSYTNASLPLGTYTYTVYANDTTGNLATSASGDISVVDTTDPLLSNLNELNGDPVEYNGAIEIRIDVTDLLLDAVWIVFDGENYSMSVVSGNTYAYTNASLALNTYSYTIYANDTTGNLATPVPGDITVEDTTDPLLSNLDEFSGDPIEFGTAIEIRIDATDLLLEAVWIVFDGENYTMSLESGNIYSYTNVSLEVNTYGYTIYANDTSGNLATSATGDITVEDTTGPTIPIGDVVEVSGDPTQSGYDIYIRVNVTDLSIIDEVWIDFDGSNYTMPYLGSGDMYYFTGSYGIENYTYSIFANDTYGNVNSLIGLDIEVSDITPPVLLDLHNISGDITEYDGDIYIRVNVSHILDVHSVWIDFDGTNYTMPYLGTGDMYYYTATYGIDTYSYTIYANSSIGIVGSLAGSIEVADTTGPTISDVIEVSGDPVEYNREIYIRVNVTDLTGINEVLIYFSGTNHTMTYLGDGYMYYYTVSLPVNTYSYTIYAEDSYGNIASSSGYSIRVEDTTGPTISNIVEVSGDPVEYNGAIYIRVNVSDFVISEVLIDFGGTNYSMTYLIDDMYYYAANPNVGTYNYTIYTSDFYGNEANSIQYDITVEDTTDPVLSPLNEFSGDPVEYNGAIEIRIDVTDLLLDAVWIVFDGETYTMGNIGGNTFSYSNASIEVGTYSYTVYANDTTGNFVSSASGDITVEDTTGPSLSTPFEMNGDPAELGDTVYIEVNVTDLSILDAVWIDFDGENYIMSLLGGDTYSYSNTTLAEGTYSYTVYANDTWGNLATSLTYDITVEDNEGPTYSDLVEVSGDPVEYNGEIHIRVNVTDVTLVDQVWIDFDGTNYTMNHLGGNMYYYTVSPDVGVYSYIIFANDTLGNEATLTSGTITVEDTTEPTLSNLVEVSVDPVDYNGTLYIRVNVTDLSTVDSVWIDFSGTTYDMIHLSDDMYYYSGIRSAGLHNYMIYANDTYGNVNSISGDITVSEYVQSMIIFDPLDYPTSNLPADIDFTVILHIDDNTTLDWAKVYFLIESGPSASAPGDNWTPITLVNGQATISSEYYDAGETLSYYFEIKDTYGVIFYVSSSGISTSNSTAQSDPFSFQITAGAPLFDILKWLPYILGAVGVVLAVSIVVVVAKKKKFQRETLDLEGTEEAANDLQKQLKITLKEAGQAERDKDYYMAIEKYQKLIIIANELFKFGRPGAADNMKHYQAKLAKYQERALDFEKPDSKQALQKKAVEFQKMAEEAERTNDFGTALVIYHQILLLREELKDKSQISATKGKIKDVITEIHDIREISAKIFVEAEEKYKSEDFEEAYSDYRYLKTIFDALGDKNLIKTIEKLISDVSKHL